MITTDFAPNETFSDALLSLKLLLQPWRWKKGKYIEKARQKIQELVNDKTSKSSVSLFLSGRSALYYYFKALNLPQNSEVLVQAFTCEAVPLPAITAGYKPVYVDIEAETYSMDINDLRKKMTDAAKVLILQHTFGYTPKYRNEILQFAHEKNLIILEDLAHGWNPDIFSRDSNKPSAISYLLSFGSSKAFSSVMGGAVVTGDDTIASRLSASEKELASPPLFFIFRALLYKPLSVLIKSTYDILIGKIIHKILNLFHVLIPVITEKEKNGQFEPAFSKAYPNALAALLLHQLKKYPEKIVERKKSVRMYEEHFKKPITNSVLSRYPLMVDNRNDIVINAERKNIFLGLWYDQVVAPKVINLKKVDYIAGSCPNAEIISKKIINLPTTLSEKTVKISRILSYFPLENPC